MKVVDINGQPRSFHEMRFAVSLLRCPECGTHETDAPTLHGDLTYRPIFRWDCPGCGPSAPTGSGSGRCCPTTTRAGRAPRWPEPSRFIRPDALLDEARRLIPLVAGEPETLGPDEWHAAWAR